MFKYLVMKIYTGQLPADEIGEIVNRKADQGWRLAHVSGNVHYFERERELPIEYHGKYMSTSLVSNR